MSFRLKRFSILASSLILANIPALACTDIQVAAKDGSQVIARTMEFALNMNSQLVSTPRSTAFTTTAPDGKPAMSWKSKYGYLMMNGLGQMFTVDGMNEQGMTFEYLYLPGFTQYQTVPAGKNSQAIPYYYLGDWVLGNFKSIDELKQALASVYVYEQALPDANKSIFPLHAAIHDATGKGIVVEFVNGKMEVSDYIGVMTNSPTYKWHVTQLPEYENLSPYNPEPVIVNGVAYGANGQGAGALGIPGSVSPSARFVKMYFLNHYSLPVADAPNAVNLAQHIINNVDIPLGSVREKNNGQDSYDLTQWTVIKDMSHKIFYYHTYGDLTLRSVDMSKVDFSDKAPRLVMPLATTPSAVDMTAAFSKSANPG